MFNVGDEVVYKSGYFGSKQITTVSKITNKGYIRVAAYPKVLFDKDGVAKGNYGRNYLNNPRIYKLTDEIKADLEIENKRYYVFNFRNWKKLTDANIEKIYEIIAGDLK